MGQTDARQGLITWDDEFRAGPRMVLQAETSMPNSSHKDQNSAGVTPIVGDFSSHFLTFVKILGLKRVKTVKVLSVGLPPSFLLFHYGVLEFRFGFYVSLCLVYFEGAEAGLLGR